MPSSLALPGDGAGARRGRYPLTVAQVAGTILRPTGRQALQYALYVGSFANTVPDQLLIGARLHYTFMRGEVTVGFEALQYQDSAGRDHIASLAWTARLLNGEGQMLAMLRRMEQDKWGRPEKSLLGLAAGDMYSLGVFLKPVWNLNPQVAVFYRFHHFSMGQGWPTWTEHAVGVRFFPLPHLMLRAETLLTHYKPTSTVAAGARLSCSFRF